MADYRWGDVLPIEQGGGQATTTGWSGQVQPPPQQQPQPQADQPNFLQRLLNPQVMAGLAGFESAFRGGNAFPAMQKGMEMGMQQEEARRQAVQRAALQNLLQNGKLSGLPPALQEIAKVTGDVGPIQQFLIKQADPNAGLTDDIKEWKFADAQAAAAGLPRQSFAQFMVGKRGGTKHGLNPIPFTRPDGSIGYMVSNTEGGSKELEIPGGGRALSAASTYQTPTEVVTRDKFGNVIARENKNVAEGERQKVLGEGRGKAQVDLPTVESAGDQVIQYIDNVLNDPYLDNMIGPIAGRAPNITEKARTLQAKIGQLNGHAFLMAFQSLKGGGAITEVEGAKATQALSRLQEMVQSGQDYRQALRDFKAEVQRLVTLARTRAGVPPNGAGGWHEDGNGRSSPSEGWGVKRLD